MSEVKIPEGYKQTEVGVIPEDWEVFNFGSLINYIKGCPFKSVDYQHTGIRIIRVSDTSFTEIKDNNPIYISDDKAKTYKPWKLQKDDLIISTVGSKPPMYDSLVGKVIKVTSKHDGSLLNQNALRVRAKSDTNGIQSLLLGHFRTERYIDFIERIYRGNANQASITLQSLFEFKIPLPNYKKEQTAIATALSDIDKLIQSLEKLIAKKEAIKTGTMQQLLTGKTRLPEFATREDVSPKGFKQTELGQIPEDWEVTELGTLVNIKSGESPSKFNFLNNGIPYYKVEQLNNGKVYACETPYYINNIDTIAAGSIVFPKRGASIFSNKIRILKYDSFIDTNLMTLTCNDYLDSYFLFLLLSFIGLDNLADTTSVPQINNKHIIPLKIQIPSKKEQTAIATILSDMDTEIQVLQQRLEKTKDIKQGMMQQLLTGKVRLVH